MSNNQRNELVVGESYNYDLGQGMMRLKCISICFDMAVLADLNNQTLYLSRGKMHGDPVESLVSDVKYKISYPEKKTHDDIAIGFSGGLMMYFSETCGIYVNHTVAMCEQGFMGYVYAHRLDEIPIKLYDYLGGSQLSDKPVILTDGEVFFPVAWRKQL